ncbi:NADAR family protein [Terrimonas pollutisoli]|uniref:NADAR family protein n=1 Tax=Terrimonas pollutisoli TaxID=3034147 RepID=UPI0023EDAFEA|nr:NADAR family protein [Terrimonas sp. H1YJ31]
MKYSTNWLTAQIKKGFRPDYLFFWGHTQKKEGVVDKSCFSQWLPSEFIVDGTRYLSAEHWMMAGKALLFNDKTTCEKIIASEKPSLAKSLGREVKDFDAKVWERFCYELVVEGNRYKFSQNQALKDFLVNTGEKVIVEASPTDTIWGIGLAQDAKEALDPVRWKGTNLLGFALMEVRDILK